MSTDREEDAYAFQSETSLDSSKFCSLALEIRAHIKRTAEKHDYTKYFKSNLRPPRLFMMMRLANGKSWLRSMALSRLGKVDFLGNRSGFVKSSRIPSGNFVLVEDT